MKSNIAGYGELLLRLTPKVHGKLIEQSEDLQLGFAGAEANILCDLSLLDHNVSFISAFPSNPIGRSGQQFLKKFGVKLNHLVWDNGRLGTYYIEHGTSVRGTNVTYDRAHSSVTQAVITPLQWSEILADTTLLVLTGITPALSLTCNQNMMSALEVARDKQIKVAFDLNYRRSLWNALDARNSFESILPYVDYLFANIGSAYDVFNIPIGPLKDYDQLKIVTQNSAEKLNELGDFEMIGMTLRYQKNANDNLLGGMVKKGGTCHFSNCIPTTIVDRLGGGDAFVAGFLHGIRKGWGLDEIINFASAAFSLTQTLAGDINYCTESEIQEIAQGNLRGYVKR